MFTAGVLVGGLLFGGFAAYAKILALNSAVGGVLPNSEGSLFCISSASVLRPVRGVARESNLKAPGGVAHGITLRCPA